MKPKLISKILDINKLKVEDFQKMYQIFCKYYENINYEKFLSDMKRKNGVIMLFDSHFQIQGFSSYYFFEEEVLGKKINIIFSGDTVIEKEFWGTNKLSLAFFRVIYKYKMKHFSTPLYWFLISKGYKTYLLLANNFTRYYPRYDKQTPQLELSIMKFVANKMYKDLFDEKKLIIKAANKFDRLKIDVAPIEKTLLISNPKIAFFENSNPNWQAGDELCCLGRVDLGLCFKFLLRSFRKIFV